MALLRVTHGVHAGRQFPLLAAETIIGRTPDCAVSLGTPQVSRKHAKVSRRDDGYYVEDLRSRNKTYLNGEEVTAPRRLLSRDRLQICDHAFEFLDPDRPADPRDPAAYELVDQDPSSGTSASPKVAILSGASGPRFTANAEVKLRTLVEISGQLARAVRLDDVMRRVLHSLFTIFVQADRGFIVLRDAPSGKLVPKAVHHRHADSETSFRISRTILREVIDKKEAVLSDDAATDIRFDPSESITDLHIHSLMCAPLVTTAGIVLGVIQLETHDPRRKFIVEDLELLAAVACLVAVAVENAQLHEVALQEEALRREIALAHQVQQALLPAEPPAIAGYEFFDHYAPARVVGGDYFDYIPLPGNRLGVVVADVSGKGVPAALLMARLSSEIRFRLSACPTPAEALEGLNDFLCEERWESRFVTVLLMVVDCASHEVTIVNAGHFPPMIKEAAGRIRVLDEACGNIPIGIQPTYYTELQYALAPGDCLIAYTDGVLDAMNESYECYGDQRLCARLADVSGDPAAIGNALLSDIRRFAGKRAQTDDMCLVCFRRANG